MGGNGEVGVGFGVGLGEGGVGLGEGEGRGWDRRNHACSLCFVAISEVPAGGHKVPARNPNPSQTLAQVSVSPLLPPQPGFLQLRLARPRIL